MNVTRRGFLGSAAAGVGGLLLGAAPGPRPSTKKILFVAGGPSHGFGAHEHAAGSRLLADRLAVLAGVEAEVALADGWAPSEESFEDVEAVVFFGDGEGRHPMKGHEALVARLAERGIGLGFMHYALIPPDKGCYPDMLDWIGGYYEPWWSVNPIWRAKITELPEHAVTRGVRPFEIDDEWYYHMRFRPELQGVQPLLTALPPDKTREGEHGPHSGNPHVAARKGKAEHLAWVSTRANGGRGFGFTGGHWHWNWAHDDYRKLVLNAIAWLAGIEVPKDGIPSRTPSFTELCSGLGKAPKDFDQEAIERQLEGWRKAR